MARKRHTQPEPRPRLEAISGWECYGIWLPIEVADKLRTAAAADQHRAVPNLNLYLSKMIQHYFTSPLIAR